MVEYIKPSRVPEITLPADFGTNVMKQVIGKEGCYFKKTTENTNVEYIWYDMDDKTIKIWGELENTLNATTIIEGRLYRIIDRMMKQNVELNEYSDIWYNKYSIDIAEMNNIN